MEGCRRRMRRFDKWSRKHRDNVISYDSYFDYEETNAFCNVERYHNFWKDYTNILNSFTTKEKHILNELPFIGVNHGRPIDEFIWSRYNGRCHGDADLTARVIKGELPELLENRKWTFHRRVFMSKRKVKAYDVLKLYNSFLFKFLPSFSQKRISEEYETNFRGKRIIFGWYDTVDGMDLDVFIDRNSLFGHEDTIKLLHYYSYSQNKQSDKTRNLLKEHGRLAVLRFLAKFSKMSLEGNWFKQLKELEEERSYYDDEYVSCPIQLKEIRRFAQTSEKILGEVYPNVKFIRNNYPRLGRGSIVANYRGFDSFEGLKEGVQFTSQNKEYIVLEILQEGNTDILVYADVKTKLDFGNRIREKDLRFGLLNHVISDAWDSLYACNRIGVRHKQQKGVKICRI
jgi:hypothetical protein